MIAAFLLGIVLLLVIGLVMRWLVASEPRQLISVGKWLLIALGLTVLGVLALTGRISVLFGLAFLLLPWFRPILRKLQSLWLQTSEPGKPQTSTIETKTLRMSLDHATGDLDGEVLKGPSAGCRLSDLSLTQLADLVRLCRAADSASLPVLEAFLDRRFPDWRQMDAGAADGREEGEQPASPGEASAGEAMTLEQAFRILGLSPGASDADIRAAYHRLIAVVHPDRGGSGFLAAQVNRARDLLLGRSGHG